MRTLLRFFSTTIFISIHVHMNYCLKILQFQPATFHSLTQPYPYYRLNLSTNYTFIHASASIRLCRNSRNVSITLCTLNLMEILVLPLLITDPFKMNPASDVAVWKPDKWIQKFFTSSFWFQFWFFLRSNHFKST